jgi:hypothetical protein
MQGKQIAALLDQISERWDDNVFISTDGSQFDSTRNKHLRQLDIECFDFFLVDLLDFMQIPKFAQVNIINIMHQIDHRFILKLNSLNKLIN